VFLGLTPVKSIVAATSDSAESRTSTSRAPPKFWETMSDELFRNVQSLHEQIDAYLPLRSREEGFPPIIVIQISTSRHIFLDKFLTFVLGLLRVHLRISCIISLENTTTYAIPFLISAKFLV
jgi:hypothetical protein